MPTVPKTELISSILSSEILSLNQLYYLKHLRAAVKVPREKSQIFVCRN